MEKIITKTSQQAKKEQSLSKSESACPECGKHAIGTYSTRHFKDGIFKSKPLRKNNYSCFRCGCEWTTGWR